MRFAGAAAIGLSAGTLAGCASTAAAATEPAEGSGAALASTCPPAIRIVAVAIALSLTLLTSAAASAADPVFKAAAPIASPSGPQTLTGDWFGQGPALRDAGFDFRLEWGQFYQGMTRGEGDNTWQYGGKLDAQARVDLSKLGFWNGLSVTAQGHLNYGHSVNGIGGSLIQVNTALAFPGIEGADRSDIMALYVTQRFGDLVSVSLGKFNMIEFVRATPLKGGIGPDTFWNINLGPVMGFRVQSSCRGHEAREHRAIVAGQSGPEETLLVNSALTEYRIAVSADRLYGFGHVMALGLV